MQLNTQKILKTVIKLLILLCLTLKKQKPVTGSLETLRHTECPQLSVFFGGAGDLIIS